MLSTLQPDPALRRHQRIVDKLSKCIQYIKQSEGGGFKSFGDFMLGLFSELPTNELSANDSAYQTVKQTAHAFLKSNPFTVFLEKISSHPAMVAKDTVVKGGVPGYSISPGLPTSNGVVPFPASTQFI
jgi:hypothetical protein